MDTVIGRPGGPVLATLVERVGRYPLIAFSASRDATEVGVAILPAMGEHRGKVPTKTYDNGKEFALHKLMPEILEAEACFAHPCRSWERRLNENANGLIRQYLPKGTNLAKVTAGQVKEVEMKLNRRPRECLEYRTPHKIFNTPLPVALAA